MTDTAAHTAVHAGAHTAVHAGAQTAIARVPTASASRYPQQLCKHWRHNLEVRFTPDHGEIVFPRNARGADWPADGLVTFDASADQLTVTVAASSPDHLVALKARSPATSIASPSAKRRCRSIGRPLSVRLENALFRAFSNSL